MADSITVTTKAELEKAKDDGVNEIIIEGELANKLKKSKKVAMLSGVGLAAVTAILGGAMVTATVTAPVTMGMSYFVAPAVAVPVAALTGLEVAVIITAASLGLGFIVALFLGYEEISFKNGRLVLRKKQS